MGDDQLDLFGAPKPGRANFPAEERPTAQIPLAEKVEHVRAAKQERNHGCHWPGCPRQVAPARWGCRDHWFRLPKQIRDQIWSTYRPGQEQTLSPSREYVEAARLAQRWIAENDRLTEAERRDLYAELARMPEPEREAVVEQVTAELLADAAEPEPAQIALPVEIPKGVAWHHQELPRDEDDAKKAKLHARLAARARRLGEPECPVDPRVCPVCEAQPAPGQPMVCSVVSERLADGSLDMHHLATTFECACGYRWTHRKPRTDVCPHGLLLKVPCGPCGRSWAEIERPQPPPAPAQPAPSQPAPRARRRSVRSDG